MENICGSQLRMGPFGELQILKISNCDKLSSLFSFSSVRRLQKLRELEVAHCESIEAIAGEGSEDEHHNNEVIALTQLNSLKLLDLPHLTGFCKLKEGNEQMGLLFNTRVSFPNLTSLKVYECYSLKHIFTALMAKCLVQLKQLEIHDCRSVKEIIQSTKTEEIKEEDSTKTIVFPKLDSLYLFKLENVKRFSSSYSIEFPLLRELRIVRCEAMRNFVGRVSSASEEYLFNEMVTFSNLETMQIWHMNHFKFLWHEQFVADDSFFKLKSICISHCSKLSVIFPSKICTRFQSVQTLYLSDCDRVEEVYQRNNFKDLKNGFSLRYIRLYDLPLLKHIWSKESEWGVFSTFQNLKSVEVNSCKDLKYVFPASVGCGLLQLQHLKLQSCNLEVVIAEEKDDAGVVTSFQFPELTELKLTNLEEVGSLYKGAHTFECPKLTSLEVLYCPNVSVEKLIPNLEEMKIDEKGFHAIHRSTGFTVEFCSKLKKVTLCSLDEEFFIAISLCILSGLKSLEKLVIEDCVLEEIFRLDYPLNQRQFVDDQHHRLKVKHLRLRSIRKLKHIVKKDSEFNHILQHLQTLKIQHCYDMMSVAPSSTALQNLTALHVEGCNSMKSLVNVSMAKTMVHLVEMTVVRCERIEEIVSNGGDGSEHDVIIFNKMQHLELTSLPRLNSFCSDKYTFSFPLLEQVTVKQCPRMNVFCGGALCTQKLRGILFEGEQQLEGSLNATISSQLRIWGGEHLEEGRLLQNVESIEVNNTISSIVVLLGSQMQFLSRLKEITVTDCDSIQVVFDLEGLSAVDDRYIGLLPRLNELKLINLPFSTQLCNEAPMGILDFNKLKVLKIDNCSRLEYALTWSMASCLSQLQSVKVRNCELMETLIMDEEGVAAKALFNELETVVLKNMPKF